MILGVVTILLGALADLIGRNRRLMELTLERVRALEEAAVFRSGTLD
jgi:hypothetical protein